MPRRRTTIGRGAFGHYVSPEGHAREVLTRIIVNGHPLTEDAVFLCLWYLLRQRGSRVLQNVRTSSDVGGSKYFYFSPDVDLLEIRTDGAVVGYELKGYGRSNRVTNPPEFYEGIDQALAYLVNPNSSPLSTSPIGSVFDYVYIVHPAGSGIDRLTDVQGRLTPIGMLVVEHGGLSSAFKSAFQGSATSGLRPGMSIVDALGIQAREIVPPKKNPYLNTDLKSLFLTHLAAFKSYEEYKVNPIQ